MPSIPSDRLIGDIQRTIQQSRQQTEEQRAQECWPGPNAQPPLGALLRWMCLTADLAAASVPTKPPTFSAPTIPNIATANPVDFISPANGGDGGYYVDTSVTYNVQEATGLSSYKTGDWVLCRPVMAGNGAQWESVEKSSQSPTYAGGVLSLSAQGNISGGFGVPINLTAAHSSGIDTTNLPTYLQIQTAGLYQISVDCDVTLNLFSGGTSYGALLYLLGIQAAGYSVQISQGNVTFQDVDQNYGTAFSPSPTPSYGAVHAGITGTYSMSVGDKIFWDAIVTSITGASTCNFNFVGSYSVLKIG